MADFNSSLPVRTEQDGDVVVKVGDGAVPSQQLTINVDGSINVTDNGGSLTVDATDLDIRDLDSAQDSIEVLQATHDNLNANANLQVGNTDVANGNPVPVSDAGGSLTIDNANLVSIDGKIANNYGAATGAVRTASQVGNTTGEASFNAGATGAQTLRTSSNITRNGTELSYNVGAADANTLRTASLVHDGVDTLAINSDGSINVVPLEDPGTERVNYDTTAAVAGGASDNHDFVFTNASKLFQVWASASGKLRIEVQIETGSATNTFNTVGVGFNSTANPNIDFRLSKYASIPAGARVRVIRQNNDNQAQDVYSTIVGLEN